MTLQVSWKQAAIAEAWVEARRRVALGHVADRRDFQFRGAALQLQTWQGGEVIISGPAETGKTIGALHYLHTLMLTYPGAQAAIVRKRQVDMPGTCLQTFEKKVLPDHAIESGLVRILGATKPERYIYRNGSVIWVGGLDNPGKTLSSERDYIYFNQAEEGELEDWETLGTRATGRAGNVPSPLLYGDCNPAYEKHWITQREAMGALTVLKSYHRDNPLLYDDAGNITEQGKKSIGILSNLTGARRNRLFLGLWTADDENALWAREDIDYISDVPDLDAIYVGVDPSGSSDGDVCGIVVIGSKRIRDATGKKQVHLYVLEDASVQAGSDVWAKQVVACYNKWKANKVIAEKNFGGDMVAQVIHTISGGENVPVKLTHASRGKAVRAEPVAAVYKEGRGHHAGKFDDLEDELCTWVSGVSKYSPGRLDALTWGGIELLHGSRSGGRGT